MGFWLRSAALFVFESYYTQIGAAWCNTFLYPLKRGCTNGAVNCHVVSSTRILRRYWLLYPTLYLYKIVFGWHSTFYPLQRCVWCNSKEILKQKKSTDFYIFTCYSYWQRRRGVMRRSLSTHDGRVKMCLHNNQLQTATTTAELDQQLAKAWIDHF